MTNNDGVITFGGSPTADVTVAESDNKVTFTSNNITRTIDLAGGKKLNDLSFANISDVERIVADTGQVILKSLGDDSPLRTIALHDKIQDAIDAANADDEVAVGKGTYAEQIEIDQAGLKLVGNNAIIQLNEAGTYDNVKYAITSTVDAIGSQISGFTISGGNTDPTPAAWQGGIKVESNNTIIQNNSIQDFNHIGILVSDGTNTTGSIITGIEISHNEFSGILRQPNEGNAYIGVGQAIYIQKAIANIEANTILNSTVGIQIQPYGGGISYGDLSTSNPTVIDNTIETTFRGIYLNYTEESAPRWTVDGNTISAISSEGAFYQPSSWQGIWIETFKGGGGYDVSNNTIDGNATVLEIPAYGIRFTNITGDPENLSISSGNNFVDLDAAINNATNQYAELDLGTNTGVDEVWTDMTGFTGMAATKYINASQATTFGIKGSIGSNSDIHIVLAESEDAAGAPVHVALEGNALNSYAGFYFENEDINEISLYVAEGNQGSTSLSAAGAQTISVSGKGDVNFYGLPQQLLKFDASEAEGKISFGNHADNLSWTFPALTEDAVILGGLNDDDLDFGASTGHLKIDGGTGNDIIIGGSGNDHIIAGLGQNTLTGGDGLNRFELKAKGTEFSELDSITDFVSDNDSIWFGTVAMSGDNMTGISGGDYAALITAANAAFASDDTKSFAVGTFNSNTYVFHDSDGNNAADAAVQLVGIDFAPLDLSGNFLPVRTRDSGLGC